MKEDYAIKPENIQPHVDIERELLKRVNDYYHFEVRCSLGRIIDFVVRDFITYEKPKQK